MRHIMHGSVGSLLAPVVGGTRPSSRMLLPSCRSGCTSHRILGKQPYHGARIARHRLASPIAAASSAFGVPGPDIAGALATIRTELNWLRQLAPFNSLPETAVEELLLAVEVRQFQAGEPLLQGGDTAAAPLVVVRSGRVTTAPASGATGLEAGPGAVFNWQQLLLEATPEGSLQAASSGVAWLVPAEVFVRVVRGNAEAMLALTQQISAQLQATQQAVQEERARQRALQAYVLPSPRRGIVGSSKYADRLRRQIVAAAKDPVRAPVLVFGEPGLEKDNVAALVHHGSLDRTQPLLRLDCDRPDWALELFGRGLKRGLVYWVAGGSLLLNNVHKADAEQRAMVRELIAATMQPPGAPVPIGQTGVMLRGRPRVLMTSEQAVQGLEDAASVIKVPPLRVRPADIGDYQRYFLSLVARRKGGTQRLALTAEAVQQLQSYAFPGNLQELEALVERAAVQVSTGPGFEAAVASSQLLGGDPKPAPLQLSEDVFWFATETKDRFRWNLLAAYPQLRAFLRSPVWPEAINMRVVAPAFVAVVAVLFLGPQDRAHNAALTAFWAYWWPLIFVAYPFLGRVWCAVCPFMIFGELAQRLRTSLPGAPPLLKWPRAALDEGGAWFLWAMFGGILVWEEVWDLPGHAALSAWLLLLITGGAVACSLVFEKRLWCRYLCPVGGMNGLFAKLSVTELRARQGVCSGNCTSYSCFKGGPAVPPEQLESEGCPVMSHPAQLTDNRNCVLCMECLRACNHRSIQLRLRPPGIDLWTSHKPTYAELALMFMLLGAVPLHHLPALLTQLHLDPAPILDAQTPHIAASTALLLAPGLVALAAHAAWPRLQLATAGASGTATASATVQEPRFLSVAYGYLPLVWGGTLAHYLQLLLQEGGHILQAAALTVGLDGVAGSLPFVEAPADVVAFLQGSTLLLGAGLSLLLTKRITPTTSWKALAPQACLITLFTAELWSLILPATQ